MQVHPGIIKTNLTRHSKVVKFIQTYMPWVLGVKSVGAGECRPI